MHPALPELIRSYRTARALTQPEFAALVGVSPALIGHVETGRRSLSIGSIERIVEALDLNDEQEAELRRARNAASGATSRLDEIEAQTAALRLVVLRLAAHVKLDVAAELGPTPDAPTTPRARRPKPGGS